MSRLLARSAAALPCVALVCGLATATTAVAGNSLEGLLEAVRAQQAGSAADDAALEAQFAADPGTQQQMLNSVDDQIAQAIERRDELAADYSRNEAALAASAESLRAELGALAPLFDVVRQVASDTASVTGTSLVAAQHGPRDSLARRLANTDYLAPIEDFQHLQLLLLEEMTESGRVVRFRSTVVNAKGVEEAADVLRVGAFTLSTGDRFLRYDPGTGTLGAVERQPRARHRGRAAQLASVNSGVAPMALDPTLGASFGFLSRSLSVAERVRQGGVIGYVIIALGAVGFVLALSRLGIVLLAGVRIGRQLRAGAANVQNPLGRVLQVYELNPQVDCEVLERQLDEAILRETPRLEKWQGAIKVIAAVAPLLGLLGTVTGMIETFQSITLSRNPDPMMMAGGISQALMTTVLGLVVAIPLVLLHSAIAGRSRALVEILEAQSAGIIARQAEKLR